MITPDKGSQFQSVLFQEFVNLLGVKHIQMTAYHPCTNGIVKRFYRQSVMFKNFICKFVWKQNNNDRHA